MAILGETFKSYVKDQISTRQNKLSSFNKDNDLLLYLTSNTTFVRLTSGVDVGPDVLQEYGLPSNLAGNLLAQQYVLEAARFNGNFTSGVGYDLSNSSYGFASNTDYGFVPPPGITQMDVKTLNRGTIREANIQLICHNVTQLHIINILFLKLKYSLLLEWGHTVYYNNEGQLIQGFDIPNFSTDFLAGGKTSSTILVELEKRRATSCGNYDAFFGWIKNFQWEVQENGTYVITISAISTGDVIESLKINTNFDPNKKEEKDDNRYSKSDLHHILGTIRQNKKLNQDGFLNGFNTGDENCLNSNALAKLAGRTSNYNEPGDNNNISSPNSILSEKEAIRVKFPNLQVTTNKNGKDIQSDQYYIKLGALLRIIESFILYYDTSKNEIYSSTTVNELLKALEKASDQPLPSPDQPNQGKPPIFKINHDYEANECLTTINQVPIDPRIALIPLSTAPTSGPISNISNSYRTKDDSNPYVAKTMHIYINIDYIVSSLDDNIDEDGDIALQSFLISLLNGISSALGSINKFEIDYDDATNAFSIVDTALIPLKYQATDEISQININSFNPNELKGGSFVTSFGLKTDIYSSIGNAIALGAQGGGSSMSAASTSYGNINSGIIDRIVTVKANANNPTDEEAEKKATEEQANIEKEFGNFVTLLNSSTQKKSLSPDDIDYYSNYIMNVLQKDLYNATQNSSIPGTIFIPLNLNLTAKGISGLRQYQVFTITENLLPKEYYNKLKFITTTIEHKVDASKGWETTINTIGIPYKKQDKPPTPSTSLLPKS